MFTVREFAATVAGGRSAVTDGRSRVVSGRTLRVVAEPTSVPLFRGVTKIWQFPSGDVLLERATSRDCLLPTVDRIDVPVTEYEQVGDAVALETDTAVHATEKSGKIVLSEFDTKMTL